MSQLCVTPESVSKLSGQTVTADLVSRRMTKKLLTCLFQHRVREHADSKITVSVGRFLMARSTLHHNMGRGCCRISSFTKYLCVHCCELGKCVRRCLQFKSDATFRLSAEALCLLHIDLTTSTSLRKTSKLLSFSVKCCAIVRLSTPAVTATAKVSSRIRLPPWPSWV